MNVVGEALLIDIYGLDPVSFGRAMGVLSFFFSMGCLAGLLLEGQLTVSIGRIRLVLFLEIMSILNSYLYTIHNYTLLICLRTMTGFISGLTSAFIPALCRDMFPSEKASLGATLTYIFIVSFSLIAGLQDWIFGGRTGIKDNFAVIICWPLVFGVARLLLLIKYLLSVESPEYWLETFTGNDQELRNHLNAYFSIFYRDEDAQELTERKIIDKHQDMEDHEEGQGFLQMFSHKYKSRFILGVILYQFKILGGINIFWFFSTYIFNRISGNGAFVTVLINITSLSSGIVAIYFQKFKRLQVYHYSLVANVFGMFGIASGILIQHPTLTIVSLVVFIFSFGTGNGSIKMVYLSEILPPAGIGAASATQWVTSALQSLAVPYLMEVIGISGIFYTCTLFIIIHIYLLKKLGIETLGKNKDQIEADFLGVKPKRRSYKSISLSMIGAQKPHIELGQKMKTTSHLPKI